MKIVLYGTDGCHLCHEALLLVKDTLSSHLLAYELVECDIVESDQLTELYGIRIPVLKIEQNGEELGWPFDGGELLRFLIKNSVTSSQN